MKALEQLQETFQAHLLSGDEQINQEITGTTPQAVADRLAIYGNAYFWRLLEVLQVDYVVLANLLGDKAFEQLGRAYLTVYPSHYFSVDLVGQYLAKFLAETKPYSEQPHLSELADFSWALSKTIDAADGSVLTQQDLVAVPQDSWPDMRISLHPSVQLLRYQWNVIEIWQAVMNEQTPPPVIKLEQINNVVVWRKEIQSFYCVLTEQEAWALQALQQKQSFGEICEGLLQWVPEEQVAQYAVNLLLRWINDQLLASIQL